MYWASKMICSLDDVALAYRDAGFVRWEKQQRLLYLRELRSNTKQHSVEASNQPEHKKNIFITSSLHHSQHRDAASPSKKFRIITRKK